MNTVSFMRALVATVLLGTASGFLNFANHWGSPDQRTVSRETVSMMGGRAATPLGRVSRLPGKEAKVEQMREQLENSCMIFSIPQETITMKNIELLRAKMPPSTKVSLCKNTLMERAVEGTSYESIKDVLTKTNIWFFVGEDGIRETVDGYGDWLKEANKKDTHMIKAGVTEGTILDYNGVIAMSKLPTKIELIAQIARAINEAGAQGIVKKIANIKGGPKSIAVRLKKASGQKLATAVSMALTDPEKNPNA